MRRAIRDYISHINAVDKLMKKRWAARVEHVLVCPERDFEMIVVLRMFLCTSFYVMTP